MPILIKANIGTADKMSTTGNLGIQDPIGNTNAFSWVFCFVWCEATSRLYFSCETPTSWRSYPWQNELVPMGKLQVYQ